MGYNDHFDDDEVLPNRGDYSRVPDPNKIKPTTVMVRFPDGDRAVPSTMELATPEGASPFYVNTPTPQDGWRFERAVDGDHIDWHAAEIFSNG